MGLHRRLREHEPRSAISALERPLGHLQQHLALAVGEPVQPGIRPRAAGRGSSAGERVEQPRVTLGATTASPAATARIAGQQLLRRHVLEQEPARAGPQRRVDVLVEVERGQHEHPRGRAGGDDPPGRLDPVQPGIRTSISTTSGSQRGGHRHRLRAVAGLADHLEVRLGLEHHAGTRGAAAPGRRRAAPGYSSQPPSRPHRGGCTRQPAAAAAGPRSSGPPYGAARSAIPAQPVPPPRSPAQRPGRRRRRRPPCSTAVGGVAQPHVGRARPARRA